MEKDIEKSFFDFQQIVRIVRKFWYVYIIFLSIFFAIAYYKIRYATPIYVVNGNIQVKDKSTHAYGNKSFLEGANMFQSFKNLSNEIDVMKSYPQVKNVLMQLDFIFTYYNKGNLRDIELYTDAPFVLDYDSSFIITNVPLNILILDENFYELSAEIPVKAYYDPFMDRHVDTFSVAQNIVSEKHRFGEQVSIGLFVFTINKNSYHFVPKCYNEKYFVYGSDLNTLANQYKAKVQIAPKGDKSSILRISSYGSSIQKETDFVNKLIEVYIKRQLDEKNEIATNTINFIDSQLGVISDSLNKTESNLQAFKSENKLYDIATETSGLMGKLNDYEKRKVDIELQNKYYEYLTNYIHSNGDFTDLIAPSTINIEDRLLTNLVTQLVELYQERNTLKYTSSEKSPAYQTILIRIKATKEALLENTSNILKSSKYSIANLNKEIAIIESQLATIPKKERDFINISRRYTINDEIYNYLLQKRAEASIARASNLSDATVIEASRIDDAQQIEPKPNKIYTMFFFMGIGCCVAFITVAILLDNKVQTKEDIEKHTGIPVIGAIEQIAAETTGTLIYGKFSSLTESFRSIRTNLQFYLKGKKNVVIGVSSCVSGDGKSFSSLNLARIYAVGGKKTVLVCGDLRKLMDNTKYNLPTNAKGLSEHLIGLATLEDVIHQGELEHLFIIPSGPMPPNSAELLGSETTRIFIEQLRTKFEVVIFDTPPIGLVSDYVPLMELVDMNLFVIRFDHTPKQSLEILDYLKDKTDNKVSHAAIFNGVQAKLMAKYSYAYGYMYGGYGYGYGGAPFMRPNKWQRMYRRMKKIFFKKNK